jgi:PIN domain nuclease of toxin-antitoxin system
LRSGKPTEGAKITERVVLDSFAILAFLARESGAERVASVLVRGEPWMTLVNLGEVAYIIERVKGKAAADDIFANLLAPQRTDGVPIRWLSLDAGLVRRAASLKARGGLSYADCFAAAAAAFLDCPVLTGDPEFTVAEKAGIRVAWL